MVKRVGLWGLSVFLFTHCNILLVQAAPRASPLRNYKSGELLVKYRRHVAVTSSPHSKVPVRFKNKTRKKLLQFHQRKQLRYKRKLLRNIHVMSVPEGEEQNVIREAHNHPEIEIIEPNFILRSNALPTDTYVAPKGFWTTGAFGQTYHDSWGVLRTKADAVWDSESQGQGVLVAVLDSGVDYNHPDLSANLWKNEAELNGEPGVDDDGNGIVDDIHGYNAFDNNGEPYDPSGHGTHVAGVIASPINGFGIVGVAPRAKIIPIRVLNDSGLGTIESLIRGLIYARDKGARVTNTSLSALGTSEILRFAYDELNAEGILSVSSAGNAASNVRSYTPASIPSVMSVSALTYDDTLAAYSNFGSLIDVTAPGVAILSLRAEGSDLWSELGILEPGAAFVPQGDENAEYYLMTGTSMATPFVTGLAAAIASLKPDMDPQVIRHCIRASSEDIGEAGFDEDFGWGVINAEGALEYAVDCDGDGIPNECELDCSLPQCGTYLHCGQEIDCNANNFPDKCEQGGDRDCDGNGYTDLCDIHTKDAYDCNEDVVPDRCEIASGISMDFEENGILDQCQRRAYVNASSLSTSPTGRNWTNAYRNLAQALEEARDNWGTRDTIIDIWVAEGTYDADLGSGDPTQSFQLMNHVVVRGGFSTEVNHLWERQWWNHPTILTGDFNRNDNNENFPYDPGFDDNAYHVVTAENTDHTAILDGFTIQGGFARGDEHENGGGVLVGNGSPTLKNITVLNNYAHHSGGGLYSTTGAPSIVGVSFLGNHTDEEGGGGAATTGGEPLFFNTVFSGNTANGQGAGLKITGGAATVTNCTFSHNNTTRNNGTAGLYASLPTIVTNSIFWGNTDPFGPNCNAQINSSQGHDIQFSCVQQWPNETDNLGNTGVNPRFENALGEDRIAGTTDDQLRPVVYSKVLDAGSNEALPADWLDLDRDGDTEEAWPFDLAWRSRQIDAPWVTQPEEVFGNVDMGAYEGGHIIFVNRDRGPYDQTGESWENAFTSLQEALTFARDPQRGIKEIWIAEGRYYPDERHGDRNATFELVPGVSIYGGFKGNERSRHQRKWREHPTTLTCDLSWDDHLTQEFPESDYYDDNCHHVLTIPTVPYGTIVDGFTITGGRADGEGENSVGGGVKASNGAPVFRNIVFRRNYASYKGGAFAKTGGTGYFYNVAFYENYSGVYGGALASDSGHLKIQNAVFARNRSEDYGGAIASANTDAKCVNCTIVENTTGSSLSAGAGIYNEGKTFKIYNSIVRNNSGDDYHYSSQLFGENWDIRYSNIAFLAPGTGEQSFDAEASFVNPDELDFRLMSQSTSIDQGNSELRIADYWDINLNDSTSEKMPVDLNDQPRVLDFPQKGQDRGTAAAVNPIDLGAFEHQAIIYVDHKATGNNDGTSWKNAYTDLRDAANEAWLAEGHFKAIWVATGTYYPDKGTGQRGDVFFATEGTDLLGGFEGTEIQSSQRNPHLFPTILSGDLNENDNINDFPFGPTFDDNSHHLLYAGNLTPDTIIDGFTFKGANASFGSEGSPAIWFRVGNDAPGSPTLSNIVFVQNASRNNPGGALFIPEGSQPEMINIRFLGNHSNYEGGAIYATNAQVNCTNCLFSGNTSTQQGGAIYAENSVLQLVNNGFVGNEGKESGGIYTQGGGLTLFNSYLWQNSNYEETSTQTAQLTLPKFANIQHSAIQGVDESILSSSYGNIPWPEGHQFENHHGADGILGTEDDNYRLSSTSDLAENGNSSLYNIPQETDLLGEVRFNGVIDIGPYERK